MVQTAVNLDTLSNEELQELLALQTRLENEGEAFLKTPEGQKLRSIIGDAGISNFIRNYKPAPVQNQPIDLRLDRNPYENQDNVIDFNLEREKRGLSPVIDTSQTGGMDETLQITDKPAIDINYEKAIRGLGNREPLFGPFEKTRIEQRVGSQGGMTGPTINFELDASNVGSPENIDPNRNAQIQQDLDLFSSLTDQQPLNNTSVIDFYKGLGSTPGYIFDEAVSPESDPGGFNLWSKLRDATLGSDYSAGQSMIEGMGGVNDTGAAQLGAMTGSLGALGFGGYMAPKAISGVTKIGRLGRDKFNEQTNIYDPDKQLDVGTPSAEPLDFSTDLFGQRQRPDQPDINFNDESLEVTDISDAPIDFGLFKHADEADRIENVQRKGVDLLNNRNIPAEGPVNNTGYEIDLSIARDTPIDNLMDIVNKQKLEDSFLENVKYQPNFVLGNNQALKNNAIIRLLELLDKE